MKIINFSVKEILPALLDKSCSQTIRPAWKNRHFSGLNEMGSCPKPHTVMVNKPPRFKVGEEIKLMWKQGSKYKWFRFFDGKEFPSTEEELKKINNPYLRSAWETMKEGLVFNKLLGTAKITEVFEIEICNKGLLKISGDNISLPSTKAMQDKKEYSKEWNQRMEDLAKRDGFKSADEMFKFFDDYYDLSVTKKFYVYLWRWLK